MNGAGVWVENQTDPKVMTLFVCSWMHLIVRMSLLSMAGRGCVNDGTSLCQTAMRQPETGPTPKLQWPVPSGWPPTPPAGLGVLIGGSLHQFALKAVKTAGKGKLAPSG